MTVQTGLDLLLANRLKQLQGARVALFANQAAVNNSLSHAADILSKYSQVQLTRILAPEHGFRGELQDMEQVTDYIDPSTNTPVISLYGSSRDSFSPSTEHLEDIDVLVVDLPDIGSRYYTFAQSLGLAMQSAKAVGIKVMVLDRPNPLGGALIEGSLLTKDCRSFCGYAPVANRHGLTLGELAALMNKGFGKGGHAIPAIDCELEIIEMTGWHRKMYFDDTGLPWVMPSPNMPTLDTALVYPGACLFEGTTVSEGRGTTRPFELIGAPYIDGALWSEAALQEGIPLKGAALRPVHFKPKFQKHAGSLCGGVQLHITDRTTFRPYRWHIALLSSLKKLYPDDFSWRNDAYEFVEDIPAIDLLYGSAELRETIDSGKDLGEILDKVEEFEKWFKAERQCFLRY